MKGPALLAGSGHPGLAEAIARELGCAPVSRRSERFPDGERHVELLESVRGRDVYVLQSTAADPDGAFFEAFQLADAARRDGASRITGVFPYFAYARQDRRAKGFECVAAKLAADLVRSAGIDRVLLLDPHSPALESFFDIPCESVTAVPLLAAALHSAVRAGAVIVSPDLGAVRLAARYASILGLPSAHVHKQRSGPESVSVQRISGDVRGRMPILVDDMISTGATLAAAAKALEAAGSSPVAAAAATHGLFAGTAEATLRETRIPEFLVSDSAPLQVTRLPVRVVSVAPLLAEAVRRLHEDRPLADLALHD